MSVTIVRRTVFDAIEEAKLASEPRQHWWMAIGALIDLQQKDRTLFHPRPLVYARFWRWTADESHRSFISPEDTYKMCRSALRISYATPEHASVFDKPELVQVSIGKCTTVLLPFKAASTVERFMSMTEPRFD